MITRKFKIDGMLCTNCEKIIERRIKAVAGVESARISYAAASGEVTFEDAKTNIGVIFKHVEEDGYMCFLVEEPKILEKPNAMENNKPAPARIMCEACNRDFATQMALDSHNAAKHKHAGASNNGAGSKNQAANTRDFVYISKKAVITSIIISILIAGFLFFQFARSSNAANENAAVNGASIFGNDVQQISLGFNRGYYPNTIKVKANQPVEITLDSSVNGCYRSLLIRDLGVSGTSRSPSDKIKFTPTKKGTFTYSCGMGMARGTIIVE